GQLLGFFRIAYGGNFVLFTPSAEAGRERGRGRLRRGSSSGRIPRPEASAGGNSRPFSPAQTSPRQTRLSSFRFSGRAFTITSTSTSACLASLGVSSGSPTYSTKTREDDLSGNRQCSTRSLCLGQNRSRSRIPQRKEQHNKQRQQAGGQLPRGQERARR